MNNGDVVEARSEKNLKQKLISYLHTYKLKFQVRFKVFPLMHLKSRPQF